MYRSFYANMPWTELPLLALVLFLGVFLAVVVRVFVRRRPSDYAHLAALALDEPAAPQPLPGVRP